LTTETFEDDLIGLRLERALERAAGAGLDVRLVETGPPGASPGSGPHRVVRVRETGPGLVELTVAPEIPTGLAGR